MENKSLPFNKQKQKFNFRLFAACFQIKYTVIIFLLTLGLFNNSSMSANKLRRLERSMNVKKG